MLPTSAEKSDFSSFLSAAIHQIPIHVEHLSSQSTPPVSDVIIIILAEKISVPKHFSDPDRLFGRSVEAPRLGSRVA